MFCAMANRKPSASRSRKALVPVPCTPDDNRLRLVEGRYADKQWRNARRLRKEKFARLGVKSSTKKRDGLRLMGAVSLFLSSVSLFFSMLTNPNSFSVCDIVPEAQPSGILAGGRV